MKTIFPIRIKEIIDSDKISTFIPERKVFYMFWCGWETDQYGNIEFDNYHDADKWINYNYCVKIKFHKIK